MPIESSRPTTIFTNGFGGYHAVNISHQPFRHAIPEIGYCMEVFGADRCYNPLHYLFKLLEKLRSESDNLALFAVGFKGLSLGGIAGWDLGFGADNGWNRPTNDADLVIATDIPTEEALNIALEIGQKASDDDLAKFGGYEEFRRIFVHPTHSSWPEIDTYISYDSHYWPRQNNSKPDSNLEIHFTPHTTESNLVSEVCRLYQPYYCTWGAPLYQAIPLLKTEEELDVSTSPYPFTDYPPSSIKLDEKLLHPFPLDFSSSPRIKLVNPESWKIDPRNPAVLAPRVALASLIFSFNFICHVEIDPSDLEIMRRSLELIDPKKHGELMKIRLAKTLAQAKSLDTLSRNPYQAGERLNLWHIPADQQVYKLLDQIGYLDLIR